MIKIEVMKYGHSLWSDTIEFAKNCSWRAGVYLANKMSNNEFEENERVLVGLIDDKIAGFCTFANKDELPTKYEFTPFVGFMFVDEKYRGNRLSEKLIESACDLAKKLGYTKMYIMSGEIGLYEKYGFVKIGDYRTIYESVDQLFYRNIL